MLASASTADFDPLQTLAFDRFGQQSLKPASIRCAFLSVTQTDIHLCAKCDLKRAKLSSLQLGPDGNVGLPTLGFSTAASCS